MLTQEERTARRKAAAAKWRATHKDYIRESAAEYRARTKERSKFLAADPVKKQRKREMDKAWSLANKERVAANKALWLAANPDKARLYGSKRVSPEKQRESALRRQLVRLAQVNGGCPYCGIGPQEDCDYVKCKKHRPAIDLWLRGEGDEVERARRIKSKFRSDRSVRVRRDVRDGAPLIVGYLEFLSRLLMAERPRLKTHCPAGHEYNQENTYVPPNAKERQCRICRYQRQVECRTKKQTAPLGAVA